MYKETPRATKRRAEEFTDYSGRQVLIGSIIQNTVSPTLDLSYGIVTDLNRDRTLKPYSYRAIDGNIYHVHREYTRLIAYVGEHGVTVRDEMSTVDAEHVLNLILRLKP